MATDIVLADRDPENHTFSPEHANGREAFYRAWDQASADAFLAHYMGSKTLMLQVDKASARRPKTHRVMVRLNYPVGYENADGLAVLQGVARYTSQVVIPVDMTLAKRQEMLDLLKAGWAHTDLANLVEVLFCPS